MTGAKSDPRSSVTIPPHPSPQPLWPSYAALDYDKPGHPTLTSQQVKLIRKTLALLRPCQAVQVRYAFPDWRGYPTAPKNTIALFLDSPYPGFEPHVLWTYNDYYDRARRP
jgi:hypothetical protein